MRLAVLMLGWGVACLPAFVCGDTFTYRDAQGETQTVDARLVGSAQKTHVLELADGQYMLVPEAAVTQRDLNDGPVPLDADGMIRALEQKFTPELFRAYKEPPFVLGLVLAEPLAKNREVRATNFLRSAGKFMKNVEGAFISFVKETRINTKP